jgi:predicted acyl esterase
VRLRLALFPLVLLAFAGPADAPASSGFTQMDTKLTMSDGVQLGVSYFEPTGTPPANGWPAVILLHGLGQTRKTSDFVNWSPNKLAAQLLAPDGYAVLTFDARAHGESGGLFTLDGPRELQDLRELFAWLTSHPHIDAQHVGAYGASYGGGLVWKAAVEGVPFAAIVPTATWTDLREALAPQGAVRAGIIIGFSSDIPRNRFGPEEQQLLTDTLTGQNLDSIRTYLASRSTRPQLGSVQIPTFLVQGRRDFAFDPNQALAAYRLLKGPKRLYLGDVGHSPAPNPPAEFDYVSREVRDWFDRYLKGIHNGIDTRAPIEVAPNPWSTATRSYRSIPSAKTLVFRLGGTRTLTATGKVVRNTKRVGHVETFGNAVARIRLASKGYAHLVVVLSALTRSGTEITVADGGADTSTVGSKPRTVAIRLQNEITSIPAGSRLRVTIAARSTAQNVANLVYLNSVPDAARASIGPVTLSLPVFRRPVSP